MKLKTKGFTLVELLVVIGIIAVLASLTIPVLSKARASAKNVATQAGLREVTSGYLMYAQNSRGALLPGLLPDFIQGKAPVASDPISGQFFSGRAARQWGFRLTESMGSKHGLWSLLRPTLAPGEFPTRDDSAANAESKAYVVSLYPVFGLNTAFLGGHGATASTVDYFKGFKADGTPNIGAHVAFRMNEVRQPSNQIVFSEVAIFNGSRISEVDDRAGLHYVSPPQADGASGQYWTVKDGKISVTLPATPKRTLGLPYSRGYGAANANMRVPVSFLDGHVEALKPAELLDMRKWAPRATGPNYSF